MTILIPWPIVVYCHESIIIIKRTEKKLKAGFKQEKDSDDLQKSDIFKQQIKASK
jgi:hypothetical protein